MGFFSFLKGGRNPHKDARPYLNAIPALGDAAYNPYIAQGQSVDPLLKERYGNYLQQEPDYSQMANDPVGLLNAILGQYKPSAGYGYKKDQLLKSAANSAAAGGYAGTENDQTAQMELVDALASGDIQQFLENVLGIRGAGMQGQQYQADKGLTGYEGLSNRGYNASGALADYKGAALGQLAQSAAGGTAARNAGQSGLFNAILSAGASGLGSYVGGGGRFGSPPANPGVVPGSFYGGGR